MKTINIWYSSREHEWLSNLCYRPFMFKSKWYVSVEHAYQTWKSGEYDRRVYSRPWQSGSKFVGKKPPRTDNNWNVALMTNFIVLSFMSPNNASMRHKFVKYIEDGVEFTHLQDNSIWRYTFPSCLRQAGIYLSQLKDVDKLYIQEEPLSELLPDETHRLSNKFIGVNNGNT